MEENKIKGKTEMWWYKNEQYAIFFVVDNIEDKDKIEFKVKKKI